MSNNNISLAYQKLAEETTNLINEANQKIEKSEFANIKEIRMMGEFLFNKVEQMDDFDFSENPSLRQHRKDLIKRAQQIITLLDDYPECVAKFEDNLLKFKDDCKSFLELVDMFDRSNLNYFEKYTLFENLAAIDLKQISQQLQTFRHSITDFKSLTQDYRIRMDQTLPLFKRGFELLIIIATGVQPFKQDLISIIDINAQVYQYLNQTEERWKSCGLSALSREFFPNTEYTYLHQSQHYLIQSKQAIEILQKYKDIKNVKDIQAKHLSNSKNYLQRLEIISILFRVAPVFASLCEKVKTPSLSNLQELLTELNGIESDVSELTTLQQDSNSLAEMYEIQIVNAHSLYHHLHSRVTSILTNLKELESVGSVSNDW